MDATTTMAAPAALPKPTTRQTATAALASLFGWGLDLFDLFILLYVAPVVGALFFPAGSSDLLFTGAYASFAVSENLDVFLNLENLKDLDYIPAMTTDPDRIHGPGFTAKFGVSARF